MAAQTASKASTILKRPNKTRSPALCLQPRAIKYIWSTNMLTSRQYRIRLETMGTPCDSLLLPERERETVRLRPWMMMRWVYKKMLFWVEVEKWINNRQQGQLLGKKGKPHYHILIEKRGSDCAPGWEWKAIERDQWRQKIMVGAEKLALWVTAIPPQGVRRRRRDCVRPIPCCPPAVPASGDITLLI